MIRRKKWNWKAFSGFFCFFLVSISLLDVIFSFEAYAMEEIRDYELYANAAVLMDGDTGRVLYGKNESEHLANASTTKILTCIVVLENCSVDDFLEVSANAARQPNVQADLNTGEFYQVGDLLYSIMLESHNDSAYALAEYVGGSVEGFAEMMNQKAREIGCDASYFITPNGLDAVDERNGMSHGTSAKDLALIMRYCVSLSPQKENFLRITEAASYVFSNYLWNDETNRFERGGRFVACTNHNSLLQSMQGMISGKTGFTNKAGYCYVGAAISEGRLYIISILGCGWPPNKTYKWNDAKKMFTHGMKNYELKEIVFGDIKLPELQVKNGIPQHDSFEELCFVSLSCREYRKKILLCENEEVTVQIQLTHSEEKPVYEDEQIGIIRYYLGDFLLDEQAINASCNIEEKNDRWAVFICFHRFVKEFTIF